RGFLPGPGCSRIEEKALHFGTAGLDQTAPGGRHSAGGTAGRGCPQGDSPASRRASQERTGRSPVRATAFPRSTGTNAVSASTLDHEYSGLRLTDFFFKR